MTVQKIIYVTPGETHLGELTHAAESQLKEIVANVLEWDGMSQLSKVFRMVENSDVSGSLIYLGVRTRTVINSWKENIYLAFISDPKNIENIVTSTQQWEVVVFGVEQKELKEILDSLKDNWYNVIDKEKINRGYNVYAVTIDLEHKDQNNFFVAPWGK